MYVDMKTWSEISETLSFFLDRPDGTIYGVLLCVFFFFFLFFLKTNFMPASKMKGVVGLHNIHSFMDLPIKKKNQIIGANILRPEEAFVPSLVSAIQQYRKNGSLDPLRKLLYDPWENVPSENPSAGAEKENKGSSVGHTIGVYGFRMFSEKFCSNLTSSLDRFHEWLLENPHVRVPRRNGSKYGLLLNTIGFQDMFDSIRLYLEPLARCAYPKEMRKRHFVWQKSFLVSYEPGKEEKIHTHADDSDLTVNVCLGKSGMRRKKREIYNKNKNKNNNNNY